MTTIELAKKAYESFAQGNVADILKHFDLESCNNCNHFPFLNGEELHFGPNVFKRDDVPDLIITFDNLMLKIDELFSLKEKVVMVGCYKATSAQSRREYKAFATHVWTRKNDKLVDIVQYVGEVR